MLDDTIELRTAPTQDGAPNPANQVNPGGITGVWAEQNTRENIWAAFKRKETFATSGPRIAVRFYEYTGAADPCSVGNFPQNVLQAGGVSMGANMPKPSAAPSFVVYATPDQQPFAEVDIIKASYDGGSSATESVHRITLSGASGATCVTWSDPHFNPAEPAFYYARVLETATPRWSHYDCVAMQAKYPTTWQKLAPGCADGTLDTTIHERAWTSPIWFLP